MPRSDRSRPALGFWRIALLFAAGVLGIAALCLVVFGNSQRQLQLGVLLGLWAFLIGAFLGFGSRRSQGEQVAAAAEVERRSAQLHEAQLQVSQLQYAQLEAAQQARSKQEVELRKFGEMQLSREAAARREADLNLEISLRREIERMMTEQLGALRDEVAALRAEVVDKLGGQLRLERIETTRVIGSDLEALQHEIRRLASSKESIATAPAAVSAPLSQLPRQPAEPVRAQQPDAHDIVDAEVIESEPRVVTPAAATPAAAPAAAPVVQPTAAQSQPAQSQPAAPTGDQPDWSAPTVVGTDPASSADDSRPSDASQPSEASRPSHASQPSEASRPSQPSDPPSAGKLPPAADEAEPAGTPPLHRQSEPVAAFTDSFDPFAGLPRLSPLPADIDLIQDPEPAPDEPAEDDPTGRRRAPDAEEQRYHGRRRADGELEAPTESSAGHRRADGESGGRRRAPDDVAEDLVSRSTER